MPRVSVVTDTTGYLPRELVERYAITLVSLYGTFGDGETFREIDLADDYGPFYERLQAAATPPSTSPPTVEDFIAAYEPLLADGGGVVSVHISSGLSETCKMAREAVARLTQASKGGERVRVMDSAGTGAQLGVLALAAGHAAAIGRDLDTVVDLVRQARLEARLWFLLDTLEFLRRGGRVGGAVAWIGSTLNIKPILTLESEVRAVERVRSRGRGVERLIDFARQLHAAGANTWVVQHARAEGDARALAERVQEIFWCPPLFVSEIGPVIGTHTGPGLLGLGGLPPRFLE